MSDVLQFPYGTTGRNLYSLWWDSTGKVAVGTTFTAVGSTTRGAAAAALAESAATFAGRYALAVPGFAAGTYTAEIYDRVGGSPAAADGPPVGVAEVKWDGAKVVALTPADLAALADAVLRRHAAAAQASADGDSPDQNSLYGLVQTLRNSDTTTNPGHLTTFNPDATELGRRTLESTALAANVVTGVKP